MSDGSAEAGLDLDHLRGWIGREEAAAERVTPDLARRFLATLDEPGETAEGAEAPLLLHLCLTPPVAPMSALGPDGHPARGGFLPPVPLPRRMWAGGAFEFHGPIRIGETVTRRSRILEVTAKAGRSGLLCFVAVEHRFEAGGRPAVTERHDIVYRGAGGPGGSSAPPAAAPAPAGTWTRRILPTTTLLFRYSALTFNGHRIHYDLAYARDEEGYPGLVVHGPLQATLLARFAAALRGTGPRTFRFRGLAPLFHGEAFTLNAAAGEAGALRLWTAREDGPAAMEAEAGW